MPILSTAEDVSPGTSAVLIASKRNLDRDRSQRSWTQSYERQKGKAVAGLLLTEVDRRKQAAASSKVSWAGPCVWAHICGSL